MGVVSRRWVWMEFMGVASGWVVRRYIDFLILLIPTPLIFAAASLLFVHKKKMFFVYYIVPI